MTNEKVFVDTNVVLDLLMERHPHFAAVQLFDLAERQRIQLFTSAVSFANINYLLQKRYGRTKTREHLQNLKLLVAIVPTFDHTITAILNSIFKDLEDAIQ